MLPSRRWAPAGVLGRVCRKAAESLDIGSWHCPVCVMCAFIGAQHTTNQPAVAATHALRDSDCG